MLKNMVPSAWKLSPPCHKHPFPACLTSNSKKISLNTSFSEKFCLT